MDDELARLRKMLPFELQVSSLKGKTNIIHLEKLAALTLESLTKKESLIMMSIYVWLTETETGDISELSQAQSFDFLWEKLTFESHESPLKGRWADDDFFSFNNKKAEQSSLIVTNHSFLSHHIDDLAIFDQCESIKLILDEAHQFPRVYQDAHKKKCGFVHPEAAIEAVRLFPAGLSRGNREGYRERFPSTMICSTSNSRSINYSRNVPIRKKY